MRRTRYLVIGASGILAPLGRLLRQRGGETVGVSRGSRIREGDWDQRVALDGRDERAVHHFLTMLEPPPDTVVAYVEAVTPSSWRLLGAAAPGQVLVLTSGWADPARSPDPAIGWRLAAPVTRVQLGWTGPPRAARWHDPGEICAGVVRALDAPDGSRLLVGRVRPWEERPH